MTRGGVAVEVDTTQLTAAMLKFQAGTYEVAREAGLSTAEDVADETRASLPRVSGTLASETNAGTDTVSAYVRMATEYAGWIEYGGKGRPYVPEGRYLGQACKDADVKMARDAERRLKAIAGAL